MNQNKRQLNINHSNHEQTKRLCNTEKKSINCMENLSNDLLLEVFDYFDGCQLYESFCNLNTRFQNLLIFSSYPLKFNSLDFDRGDPSDRWRKFIYPNRHRIISLHVFYWGTPELFFKSITIDQSFDGLESFVLFPAKSTVVKPLLQILTSLPRLYSLSLTTSDNFFAKDLSEIYRLILGLPVLKYLLLRSTVMVPKISPRNKDNNRCSTIECMHIDHPCRSDHLMLLLSNTPHLRRLIFKGSLDSEENIGNKISITLSNLHYISIERSNLNFDQFESFIMQLCSQLRMLRIATNRDRAYLDANRWEQLISKHLPYLQKFHFEHQEFFEESVRVEEYHRLIPQFMSLFWIKRQWIFALKTNKTEDIDNEIIYSISPNKRKWYDLPENLDSDQSKEITRHSERRTDESSVESDISTELTLECCDLEDINRLLTIIRITTLIVVREISVGKLINLINHLPNLDTLSVNSILFEESDDSSLEERSPSSSTTNQNKIAKVNAWSLKKLTDIQFLLDLCPNVKYLMVKHWSTVDCRLLVQSILTHNISDTPYLHTIGLCIEGYLKKTIEELQRMIALEKLSYEYSIKYIDKKIYIQWKQR